LPNCSTTILSPCFPRYDEELAKQAKAILEVAEDGDVIAEVNAHAVVIEQHRAFFKEFFGIDINGAPLGNDVDRVNKHKKVKSVVLYNDIVHVLSNWGDSDALASAAYDDLDAIATYHFCKQNQKGYNYSNHFKVDDTENLDGSPAKILIHKKSGKVVLHMLDMFDIITPRLTGRQATWPLSGQSRWSNQPTTVSLLNLSKFTTISALCACRNHQ
jgi:hypothetical protein